MTTTFYHNLPLKIKIEFCEKLYKLESLKMVKITKSARKTTALDDNLQ